MKNLPIKKKIKFRDSDIAAEYRDFLANDCEEQVREVKSVGRYVYVRASSDADVSDSLMSFHYFRRELED